MEEIIFSTGNRINYKIIAYFIIFLLNDLFYLIFIIPLFSLWYYLIFIVRDKEIGSWFFLMLVFIFIYGYIKRKKLHKYYIPIIKIHTNGNIELKGFRGFKPFQRMLKVSNYKFYILTEGNLRTSSNCIVFEIETKEKILYWNNPKEVYEILHMNFPDFELPPKKIISIV